jgi:UDP-glucose 4-epimerase
MPTVEGSHLADELLERGGQVHVLDDLSTGSMDNIAHLKGHSDFGYTIDSANNARLVAELVDEADIEVCLTSGVPRSRSVEQLAERLNEEIRRRRPLLHAAAIGRGLPNGHALSPRQPLATCRR